MRLLMPAVVALAFTVTALIVVNNALVMIGRLW